VRGDRRSFADALYVAGRSHDAAQDDRLDRWRNVEPETAEMLGVLVRALAASRVLEIGTSNGYSTLWLGDAVEAVDGIVVSLELLPERTALAAEHVAQAGLSEAVQLRTEDAARALANFDDASFDVVFLDAERPFYVDYWPDLVRVLARPGLLAVDNVLSHADEVADFRALVEADDRVVSSVVAVGAGVLLVARA
jgi:predicted O-methyltransferase YrrM